jgi:hypothetical protein
VPFLLQSPTEQPGELWLVFDNQQPHHGPLWLPLPSGAP